MIAPSYQSKTYPLKMVTSNKFGRYKKISAEKTFNMFITDDWLVSFPGYEQVQTIVSAGEGRGLFNSVRAGSMFQVSNNEFNEISTALTVRPRGTLATDGGDISMAENLADEIAICDKKNLYIYNYNTGVFSTVALDFIPDYVDFQDGYFIAAVQGEPKWRLSALNNGLSWPAAPENVGEFESKADNVKAVIPIPGKQNQLLVMGGIITQAWTNVGASLFPYQLTTAFNIDYGCINPDTIAKGDNFVIWLGINDKSGPAILLSEGGPVVQISTDGINSELQRLTKPEDSYGVLFKQDGHIFYILTLVTDNVTYLYDITAKKFFFLTDKNMDHFIVKKLVYFNGKYYFISFTDGNLYELSSEITTYDGDEIPRVSVLAPFRLVDSSSFIADFASFTMEQGENADMERIDVSISKDGGVSFSNYHEIWGNEVGDRTNEVKVWEMGQANDLTFQFRFWSNGRVALTNGVLRIHT